MSYPPPPGPVPYVQPTSGKAKLSLALGLAGLVLSWCTFGAVSVAAIVFGHQARRQIKANPALGGANQALWGLILGYPIAVAFVVAAVSVVAQAISGNN